MIPSFGIYIHWPFCASKCPYCDFNSHVQRSVEEDDWTSAILNELNYYFNATKNQTLKSIFFGGGTPSLMAPKTVDRIINHIAKLWSINDLGTIEITLEANPHSVEAEKFASFKQSGVNRISLGVQSFDNDALKFLGRKHQAKEAIKALDIAFKTFSNVSFDLIYARPKQTLKEWEKELTFALTFNSHHMSLYQLTIEQGTPFYKQYERGEWQIPLHEEAYDFYNLTQEMMNLHQMPAYEVSNHAKNGYACDHNLIYWRYKTFLGIGPGAHGRLKNSETIATQNYKSPKVWLDAVHTKPKKGAESYIVLTEQEIIEERLLMGFRLFEPIILNEKDIAYLNVDQINWLHENSFIAAHYDQQTKELSLRMLEKGRFVLNTVLGKILVY